MISPGALVRIQDQGYVLDGYIKQVAGTRALFVLIRVVSQPKYKPFPPEWWIEQESIYVH